jgi:putative phosphoserine phosphatase/1-acylglycerol-3-phosphate O-acyltransferase
MPAIAIPGPRRLALFDMDDTLVRGNTAGLYLAARWRAGRLKHRDLLKLIWLRGRYRFDLADMARLTHEAARQLAGESEPEMVADAEAVYRDAVRPRLCPHTTAALRTHQQQGDAVAIVTASTPYIARILAQELAIPDLLCTELEVRDGVFTGGVVGEPCWGEAKVRRATELAQRHGLALAEAVFYTDSHSDAPLLAAVAHPRVVRPDPRLRVLAWHRRWPILPW